MTGRAFLDKTFGDPVHCYKKEDDPKERIPGIDIDHPVEGQVGYKDGGNKIEQYPVEDIFLLELQLDLFFNKVFYF